MSVPSTAPAVEPTSYAAGESPPTSSTAPTAVALEPALREPVAGAVLLSDDRSVRPAVVLAELIRRTSLAGADLIPGADVIGFATIGDRVDRCGDDGR